MKHKGCFLQHHSIPLKGYRRALALDYNHLHNILRLFDVLRNFPSPQVKRWAIITYKHGIYELPHQLSNDLRLNEISKLENIRKMSKLHRMIA